MLNRSGIEYDRGALTLALSAELLRDPMTRLTGYAQAMGGCAQIAIGVGALATPEPTMVTKVVGVALIGRGADNCQAGIRQMATGRPTQTVVSGAVQGSLRQVMSAEEAAELDMWLEFLLDASLTARGSAPQSRIKATSLSPRPQSRPSSPLPDSYINYDNIVDMRVAPSGSPLTAGGFPRNQNWFWRQMAKQHPEMFDTTNLHRIQVEKSAPIVNDQWVKYNPAHQGFRGETLAHHHINQGPFATPLPKSVHKEWSKVLHPYTRGGRQ